MDMQKQIKDMMAKTQAELDVNKTSIDNLTNYVFSNCRKNLSDLLRVYKDIGITVCRIKKLENMMLEQQYHANKVCLLDFITFPIVALLKIFKK